jgi:hypothetical protein
MAKGTFTRTIWSARGATDRSRGCPLTPGDAGQFAEGVREALSPEVDLQSLGADIDPRYQELDDPGLLGGE